jgi:hypothetical protein
MNFWEFILETLGNLWTFADLWVGMYRFLGKSVLRPFTILLMPACLKVTNCKTINPIHQPTLWKHVNST